MRHGVRVARTRTAGAILAVSAALASAEAFAADPNLEARMADTPSFDTVLWWGADLAVRGSDHRAYGADAGFVTAINGDIGATGWTISGSLGASRTTAPLSDTNAFSGTLLVGHQWHAPGFYVSLAAGLHYVNNNETPAGGPTDGDEFGAVFQYGFETKTVEALYIQSYGSYSTAYDQAYFHSKLGYKARTLRFGAEFTAFDDTGSRPTLRYGAFVGDIPITDRLSMVISAGYQHELEALEPDGFYAQIGFSVPLDLR